MDGLNNITSQSLWTRQQQCHQHKNRQSLFELFLPSFSHKRSKIIVYSSANKKHQNIQSTTMQFIKRTTLSSGMSLPPKKKMKMSADHEKAMMVLPVTPCSPTEFIINGFQDNGYSIDEVRKVAQSQLLHVTPAMTESYGMAVSKAVRDNDLDKLRELYNDGEGSVDLDCCNKFGDSLIHIACRRGNTRIVDFLVNEAKVSTHRSDDLMKTPLHDACWTAEPNFEIVDMILRSSPMQALCKDNRGFTPFEYARRHHRDEWLNFLAERRSLLVLSTSSSSKDEHKQ